MTLSPASEPTDQRAPCAARHQCEATRLVERDRLLGPQPDARTVAVHELDAHPLERSLNAPEGVFLWDVLPALEESDRVLADPGSVG